MDPTLQIILALIPVAERIIIKIGGKLLELNTEDLTKEDLLKMLEESRSESWPDLKFLSPSED